MDRAGNATAVWRLDDGVVMARFDAAMGAWAAPAPLKPSDGDAVSQLDLDVAPAGDAVVVWRQLSAGTGLQSIWSSWFDATVKTWHPAALVERDETGDAGTPSVAALSGGGAVAVWHQWDGLCESLWANQLGDVPLAWTGRSLLETTDSADAIEPDVATDAHGNAVAVWTQSDGTRVTVWTSRRDARGDGWSAPTMLGVTGLLLPGATPAPRVALDASGNGLAIWSLATEDASTVWTSRYDAATGAWQAAAPREADAIGAASDAALALDANGDAFVAWRRGDGDTFALWADTFSARTGAWAGAVRLDVGVGIPAVAAAGDRQAVVVWPALVGTGLRATRFSSRSGRWEAPSLLAADTTKGQPAQVAQDATGRAIAVFARDQAGGERLLSVRSAAP